MNVLKLLMLEKLAPCMFFFGDAATLGTREVASISRDFIWGKHPAHGVDVVAVALEQALFGPHWLLHRRVLRYSLVLYLMSCRVFVYK